MGFMGLCVPERYGGAGADFVSYCLLIEEVSWADAGVGVTLAVHTSAGTLPIADGRETVCAALLQTVSLSPARAANP